MLFFCGSLPSGVCSLVRILELFSLGVDCLSLRLFCWFVSFVIWPAMARPKRIARRLSRGGRGSQGGESSTSTPVSQTRPVSQARTRRYDSHGAVLRELRRIERQMQPAIARLPFQRLVREICDQWSIGLRWNASGLLCLQEIAEDWLIEFFEDSYVLAAFAHRLTIMPRDFDVLRRLRYRYDQLLVPGLVSDRRMRDILTVPPLHPRSRVAEPSQAVHDRATRSQCQRRQREAEPIAEPATATEPATDTEARTDPITEAAGTTEPTTLEPATATEAKTQADTTTTEPILEPPASTSQPSAREAEEHYGRIRERELAETHAHNLLQLEDLSNHGNVRLAFNLGNNDFSRTLVGTLEQEDLQVLQSPELISVTDSLMQPLLWYVSLLCYVEHICNRVIV